MTTFVCPQIIGHRGASYYAPENTKASIELAAKQGVKWVEVDLHLTADDNIIINHNSTVTKRTNGAGKIIKMTTKELLQLDAGSWHSKQYVGQRLLTLEQLIRLATKLDINLNLELKANTGVNEKTAEVAAEIVKKHWPKAKPLPLFSSFSLTAVDAIKHYYSAAPRAVVVKEWNRFVRQAVLDLECTTINADRRLITPKRLQAMHETGCKVLTYTVNGLKSAVKFMEMGVDGIFTDRPNDIIAALKQHELLRI